MDEVLTLDNWWDGPLSGLCTFGGEYCVYERIFSEETDDYTDFYYLTPIDNKAASNILENWERWCGFMSGGGDARLWKNSVDINDIAKNSPRYREHKKRGTFNGKRPVNLYSELSDMFAVWE